MSAPPPDGWTAPWRPDTTRLLAPASAAARQARSWRHEIFPEYKGKRSPPPEPLLDAQPVIQELLDALGLPWVQITSIEADDVIATLATTGAAAGLRTAIVSPDKDFQQARMICADVGATAMADACALLAAAAEPDGAPAAADASEARRAACRAAAGFRALHRG